MRSRCEAANSTSRQRQWFRPLDLIPLRPNFSSIFDGGPEVHFVTGITEGLRKFHIRTFSK